MSDLESRCESAFKEALSLVRSIHDSPNWSTYDEDLGVTYSTHPSPTEQEIVRAQVTVKKPVQFVFSYLSNPFNKRDFDQVLITLDVIEDFGTMKCIFYQNNLAWPLDSRETVYVEGTHKDSDGTYFVLAKSIPADEVPIDPGYIRADMLLCGHVIKGLSEETTSITSYFYIDPLGSLPVAAKVTGGKKQAGALLRIKEKIETY